MGRRATTGTDPDVVALPGGEKAPEQEGGEIRRSGLPLCRNRGGESARREKGHGKSKEEEGASHGLEILSQKGSFAQEET